MLSFHLNPDLKGYKFAFKPNFFNSLAYQKNQQYNPLFSFYILNRSEKSILGMIHLTQVGNFVSSQPKAPFGGFEIDAQVDEAVFLEFLDFIHDELKKLGVKQIKLKEAPDVLVNEVTLDTSHLLMETGYRIAAADVNHFIYLEDNDGMENVHKMERRHFRKSLAKNYRWKLENEDTLPEIYSFIERCRSQQGLKVNINFEELMKSFEKFPGKYRLFSIRYQDYLAAATVTVEINENILYNYLPASDKKFNTDSPMVFLLISLQKYARSLGYEILDLGVSSIKGQIQTGLAEFKERMGALICEKRTLEKSL